MKFPLNLVATYFIVAFIGACPHLAVADASAPAPASSATPAAIPAPAPVLAPAVAAAPASAAPGDSAISVGSRIEVMHYPRTKESQEAADKVAQAAEALAAKTSDPAASEPAASLRDEIRVPVVGLPALLAKEKASTTKGKIVLFLDGRPIFGASPYPPLNPADGKLAFVLQRDESSRDAWTHLLGKPNFSDREVEVSVGLSDRFPEASAGRIKLQAIPTSWFSIWAVVLVTMVIGFLLLASRSDLLRDVGPSPTGAASRKPYSLAKTQAMWWFFLILASYLFVGLITGDYSSTINSTVLSLMGISVATTVGGAIIDTGSTPSAATAARAADAANATAASAAHAANAANTINASDTSATAAAAATSATATATLAANAAATANAAAAAATIGPAPKTAGVHWWMDILSDDTGVNFHRFQMVAWTLVLGVIFVHDVYIDLAMPVFNATLLGLLGISSGTYLGLKATSEK